MENPPTAADGKSANMCVVYSRQRSVECRLAERVIWPNYELNITVVAHNAEEKGSEVRPKNQRYDLFSSQLHIFLLLR